MILGSNGKLGRNNLRRKSQTFVEAGLWPLRALILVKFTLEKLYLEVATLSFVIQKFVNPRAELKQNWSETGLSRLPISCRGDKKFHGYWKSSNAIVQHPYFKDSQNYQLNKATNLHSDRRCRTFLQRKVIRSTLCLTSPLSLMSWLSSRWIMSRLFMSRCLIILVLRLPYILFITLLHTISSARGSRIFKGKMMREVHILLIISSLNPQES